MRFGTNCLIRISTLILTLSSFYSNAQLSAIQGKTSYDFLLNLEKDTANLEKMPVLIFLHGKSLSGNNLEMVKKYGVITEILRGRKVPGIVIAPQVPKGKSWEPDKILEVLQYVQAKYQTDSNRIYVAGMSLGGYGTLHFAGKYAHLLAGAVALCGGGNTTDACKLSTLPLWIQHGRRDKAVPITESTKMVNSIRKCNGGKKLIYTIHPNFGHGELERVFHSDDFYNWLFAQKKEED